MDDKMGYILFPDYRDSVEMLGDAEAGRIFKALLRLIDGQEPGLDPAQDRETFMIFSIMRGQYQRNASAYAAKAEAQAARASARADASRQNGAKGGRPKKQPAPAQVVRPEKYAYHSDDDDAT